jgi:3-phosphoshikimate 1-carboxyvinyltransferase
VAQAGAGVEGRVDAVTTVHVDPRHLVPATLTPPHSKSDAQRALVVAHALGRPELLRVSPDDEALPKDTRALARGLATLRAPDVQPLEIDCGDGGAPFRFLLGQAAVTAGARVRFTGSLRLAERPHLPLVEALLSALGPSGLQIRVGKPWPVEIDAPADPRTRVFRVGAMLSSQYASSLLLAAAALHRRTGDPISVEWTGEMASAGYLDLTCQWISRSGFRLAKDSSSVAVVGLEPRDGIPSVPGDWSSIGYLLLAAWRSGAAVASVDLEAAHPDRAMARILEQVGLHLQPTPEGMRVVGEPRAGLRASGRECPDLLPTLAVLACALPEPSALTDVSILRGKESDRVQGIVDLVHAAGGTATLREDFVVIDPPKEIARTLKLDARGDHRMAMSAASLAILGGSELILSGAEHVAKSFPTFWSELHKIGVHTRVT